MENVVQNIINWLTMYSGRIIAAIAIFIIGRWLSGKLTNLLSHVLERSNVEQTLVKFLTNIAYYSLLVVVIIASINKLGVNTTSLLTVVAAAGLAIGLALKDSLSNFSSGVMLILFRPFKVDDAITAAGVTGAVQEISIFNTVLTTPDNQKIIVPNSAIMGGIITNITANATRRIDLTVGIAYTDSIALAKEVLAKVLAQESRLLNSPAPTIAVAELGDSSINLIFRPWVRTEDYWAVRFDLTENIKLAFDEAGLNIPFPQQDVHLFVEKNSPA